MTKHVLTAVSMLFFAVACATSNGDQSESSDREALQDAYERHATGSRNQTVYPRVDTWFSLGSEKLVARTRDYQYFLIELEPRCGRDLRYSTRPDIATEQHTQNRLTRQDRVLLGGERCRITSIREVDHQALAEELEENGVTHRFIRLDRGR